MAIAGMVLGPLIAAGATIGVAVINDPASVSCSAERKQAGELYRADGVWTELPESSTTEEQCDINGYISNLPELEGDGS